jgi:hypothetical protein
MCELATKISRSAVRNPAEVELTGLQTTPCMTGYSLSISAE